MNFWQKKYDFSPQEIIFGLIGEKLKHSFSKDYFSRKFAELGLRNYRYELFEISNIDEVVEIFQISNLAGLNVTIPYKEKIIPHLSDFDENAKKIGAVNCLQIRKDKTIKAYNTDYYGFEKTLSNFTLPEHSHALILGKGGAAKAVAAVLETRQISYDMISREILSGGRENYAFLADKIAFSQLIINATPLGMYPNIHTIPDLPYEALTEKHILIDLVYNPEISLFLTQSKSKHYANGLQMLHAQAEKSWEIWTVL
jgi:shikimate dehydrogenase